MSAKKAQESVREKSLTLEKEVYHDKQIRDTNLSESRKRYRESSQMPDLSRFSR